MLAKITSSGAGAASIVNKKNRLVGIFTDGDLRRQLGKDPHILKRKIKEVMTKHPTVVKNDDLASAVLKLLESKKIDEVPVVDKTGSLVGMLDIQDLIAAGII